MSSLLWPKTQIESQKITVQVKHTHKGVDRQHALGEVQGGDTRE